MDPHTHQNLIAFLLSGEFPAEFQDISPQASRYAKKNYRRKASSFRVTEGKTLFKVSN